MLTLPSAYWCPFPFVLAFPSCWLSGRVEGRGGVVLSPSCLSYPLCVVSASLSYYLVFLFRLCGVVFVVGGEVGWCVVVCGGGTVSRFILLFLSCVCCHSIVGLVRCFCDRVVSLWNGGG